MNYRHHFHAGNFADVAKHVILLALVDGLQRKDKGFLYLDTHAGRGAYDLATASRGDSLERKPEWPDGLGRIEAAAPKSRPAAVTRYLEAVRAFAAGRPEAGDKPYPGSPLLMQVRMRPQDRMVLCEFQRDECLRLHSELFEVKRVRVEQRDGYEAVRGCLPPPERRALVLIDPPYEGAEESDRVFSALREGLRRLPGGTFAIWYPITERVGVPSFVAAARPGELPPAWTAEITVAGPASAMKMRGAGVMVINPPWQLDQTIAPVMRWLAETMAQEPGGEGRLRWLSPEV